jgi:hypothetical protein
MRITPTAPVAQVRQPSSALPFDAARRDLFDSMGRFDPLTYRPTVPNVLPFQRPDERSAMHEVRAHVDTLQRNAALRLDHAGLGPLWHDYVDQLTASPQERERLHAELTRFLHHAGARAEKNKKPFNEPRPFQVDRTLDVFGPPPTGTSYPSGHATIAYAAAGFLAHFAPERRDELLSAAANVARSRVVLGAHYPGDVAVGARNGLAFADETLSRAAA